MAQKFNTIPAPDASLQGLLTSVQALKAVVEQLTGSQGNLGATRTFVQQDQPTAVLAGDVWVKISDLQNQAGAGILQSDGTITSVWSGTQWVVMSVAGCFYEKLLTGAVNVGSGGANVVPVVNIGPVGAANQVWRITAKANIYNDTNAAVMTAYLYQGGQTLPAPASLVSANYIAQTEVVTANANWVYDVIMERVVLLTQPAMFGMYGYNQSGGSGVFSAVPLHGNAGLLGAATFLRAERLQ